MDEVIKIGSRGDGQMIAVLMSFPRHPDIGLFEKFVKETPGVVSAYQLKGDGPDDATFTVWESAAAREAYMQSQLRKEVDSALPVIKLTMFEVMKSK